MRYPAAKPYIQGIAFALFLLLTCVACSETENPGLQGDQDDEISRDDDSEDDRHDAEHLEDGDQDPEASLDVSACKSNTPTNFCPIDHEAIETLIGEMSIEAKLAQMLVVGLDGRIDDIPEDSCAAIRDIGLGGVLLQPVRTLDCCAGEIAALLNNFNELALDRTPSIPLFFSIDQEGGIAQAFQGLFGGTDGPGNMALGALYDGQATYDSYAIMGRELRAFGANVAYAPVIDLHPGAEGKFMYTKAFHEDPEFVAKHAHCAVKGFQDEGTIACMKHFPGGGASIDDPHMGRPICTLSETQLRETHIRPFVAAIAAGADMAMIYSVVYTALDEVYPASLSRKIKVDLLREELGFEGLISTGALDIAALDEMDLGEDRNVLAVQSGSDLLLHVDAGGASGIQAIVDVLVQAVVEGKISEDEVDTHVRRILTTKYKYCLFEDASVDPETADSLTGTPESTERMGDIAARAITVVRNEGELWPLDPEKAEGLLVICPSEYIINDPAAGFPNMTGTTLDAEIQELAPKAVGLNFNVPGSFAISDFTEAIEKAQDAKVKQIVIGTFNAYYDEEQAEMVRNVLTLGKPTIVIALAAPFDLLAFPEATSYLAVYSFRTLALEMAAETLFGLRQPEGRLPVSMPGIIR